MSDVLQRQPDRQVDRDFLLETFILNMPQEDDQRMFDSFMRWARFGNLFAYDKATEQFSLLESQA